MRILHIAYSGQGGVGESAVQLALHTDRSRFESAVCFIGTEPLWPDFSKRLRAAGRECFYLPLDDWPRSLWRLLKCCLRWRPDCVVAHGPFQGAVLPLLRIARPASKGVLVFQGPPSLARSFSGILRLLPGVAAASRVVCVGPHLACLIRRGFGRQPVVIPHGIEIGGAPSEPAASDVLTISRLAPPKDQETLVRAAAVLFRRRTFRLRLAGDGPLRRPLEALAGELGLDACVEFLGPVGAEERRRLLSRAAVFVCATEEEGCPLAVLEAMAAARPIVASRAPGITGVLEDGQTAILVPPRSPAALAGAIEALLDSPAQALQLGRAARHVAIKRYSLDAWVRAYEELFDSLLNPPCPTRKKLATAPVSSVSSTSRP